MGGYAWVTLATNDSYSLGALVLAHSLKRANTAHNLVVMITPAVSQRMREQLQTVFNVVKVVDVLDSKDEAHLALMKRPELGITFTKIHCWRLTEFEKCVFLDADTLVVRNCDELFEREEFSAAPDVSWPDCFNSGVFVYKPSVETFNKLLQFAVEKGSFDGGDQGLLNQFFSDWATEDIKKHLPFVYNLTSVAAYSYIPAFKHYGAETRIVHFIGTGKPWLQQLDPASRTITPTSGSEHLAPLLQQWWDLFCEKVHPGLDKSLEYANGMSHLPVEAYSNSLAVECNDEPETPQLLEPCTLYREKDDFRQFNLPYQPFDVKGSSGELLNVEFLIASVVTPAPSENGPDSQQRQPEKEENNIEDLGNLERHDENMEIKKNSVDNIKTSKTNNDEKPDDDDDDDDDDDGDNNNNNYNNYNYSNSNSNEREFHDQEPNRQTYEEESFDKEVEKDKKDDQDEHKEPEAPKDPFDYHSFFPDETCVNNYLQQNYMLYKSTDNHQQHYDRGRRIEEKNQKKNENMKNQELNLNVSLPRFLTIPQDDKRQSGNEEKCAVKEQQLEMKECVAFSKPNQHNCLEQNYEKPFSLSEEKAKPEEVFKENTEKKYELQKSKSMSSLAPETKTIDSAPRNIFWKSQSNVNLDPNKKYSMPKLKPLLPKQNSFSKLVTSSIPKVTQYTEFLMSSEYKDPVDIPKDKIGFVESHMLKDAQLKRSKSDADIKQKFGPLPYIIPLPAKPVLKQKSPLTYFENNAGFFDLKSCKRQMGNKPKPKDCGERKENCIVPALKPLIPTKDKKSSYVKKRKTKEMSLYSEDDHLRMLSKKNSRSGREEQKKKFQPGQTKRQTDLKKTPEDVDAILLKLSNFSKNYQHYFGEISKTGVNTLEPCNKDSSRIINTKYQTEKFEKWGTKEETSLGRFLTTNKTYRGAENLNDSKVNFKLVDIQTEEEKKQNNNFERNVEGKFESVDGNTFYKNQKDFGRYVICNSEPIRSSVNSQIENIELKGINNRVVEQQNLTLSTTENLYNIERKIADNNMIGSQSNKLSNAILKQKASDFGVVTIRVTSEHNPSSRTSVRNKRDVKHYGDASSALNTLESNTVLESFKETEENNLFGNKIISNFQDKVLRQSTESSSTCHVDFDSSAKNNIESCKHLEFVPKETTFDKTLECKILTQTSSDLIRLKTNEEDNLTKKSTDSNQGIGEKSQDKIERLTEESFSSSVYHDNYSIQNKSLKTYEHSDDPKEAILSKLESKNILQNTSLHSLGETEKDGFRSTIKSSNNNEDTDENNKFQNQILSSSRDFSTSINQGCSDIFDNATHKDLKIVPAETTSELRDEFQKTLSNSFEEDEEGRLDSNGNEVSLHNNLTYGKSQDNVIKPSEKILGSSVYISNTSSDGEFLRTYKSSKVSNETNNNESSESECNSNNEVGKELESNTEIVQEVLESFESSEPTLKSNAEKICESSCIITSDGQKCSKTQTEKNIKSNDVNNESALEKNNASYTYHNTNTESKDLNNLFEVACSNCSLNRKIGETESTECTECKKEFLVKTHSETAKPNFSGVGDTESLFITTNQISENDIIKNREFNKDDFDCGKISLEGNKYSNNNQTSDNADITIQKEGTEPKICDKDCSNVLENTGKNILETAKTKPFEIYSGKRENNYSRSQKESLFDENRLRNVTEESTLCEKQKEIPLTENVVVMPTIIITEADKDNIEDENTSEFSNITGCENIEKSSVVAGEDLGKSLITPEENLDKVTDNAEGNFTPTEKIIKVNCALATGDNSISKREGEFISDVSNKIIEMNSTSDTERNSELKQRSVYPTAENTTVLSYEAKYFSEKSSHKNIEVNSNLVASPEGENNSTTENTETSCDSMESSCFLKRGNICQTPENSCEGLHLKSAAEYSTESEHLNSTTGNGNDNIYLNLVLTPGSCESERETPRNTEIKATLFEEDAFKLTQENPAENKFKIIEINPIENRRELERKNKNFLEQNISKNIKVVYMVTGEDNCDVNADTKITNMSDNCETNSTLATESNGVSAIREPGAINRFDDNEVNAIKTKRNYESATKKCPENNILQDTSAEGNISDSKKKEKEGNMEICSWLKGIRETKRKQESINTESEIESNSIATLSIRNTSTSKKKNINSTEENTAENIEIQSDSVEGNKSSVKESRLESGGLKEKIGDPATESKTTITEAKINSTKEKSFDLKRKHKNSTEESTVLSNSTEEENINTCQPSKKTQAYSSKPICDRKQTPRKGKRKKSSSGGSNKADVDENVSCAPKDNTEVLQILEDIVTKSVETSESHSTFDKQSVESSATSESEIPISSSSWKNKSGYKKRKEQVETPVKCDDTENNTNTLTASTNNFPVETSNTKTKKRLTKKAAKKAHAKLLLSPSNTTATSDGSSATGETTAKERICHSGIAGAIAQLSLESGVEENKDPAASTAHQEYLRRQNWETGNMDYMGRDSFNNIWSKICQTLEGKETVETAGETAKSQNTPETPAPTMTSTESQIQTKPPTSETKTDQPPQGQPQQTKTSDPEAIETLPSGVTSSSLEEDDIIFAKPDNRQPALSNIKEEEAEGAKPSVDSSKEPTSPNTNTTVAIYVGNEPGAVKLSDILGKDEKKPDASVPEEGKSSLQKRLEKKEEVKEVLPPIPMPDVTTPDVPKTGSVEAPKIDEKTETSPSQASPVIPDQSSGSAPKSEEGKEKVTTETPKVEEKTSPPQSDPVVSDQPVSKTDEAKQTGPAEAPKVEEGAQAPSEGTSNEPTDSQTDDGKKKKGVFTKILEIVGVQPKEKNGTEISKSVFYDVEGQLPPSDTNVEGPEKPASEGSKAPDSAPEVPKAKEEPVASAPANIEPQVKEEASTKVETVKPISEDNKDKKEDKVATEKIDSEKTKTEAEAKKTAEGVPVATGSADGAKTEPSVEKPVEAKKNESQSEKLVPIDDSKTLVKEEPVGDTSTKSSVDVAGTDKKETESQEGPKKDEIKSEEKPQDSSEKSKLQTTTSESTPEQKSKIDKPARNQSSSNLPKKPEEQIDPMATSVSKDSTISVSDNRKKSSSPKISIPQPLPVTAVIMPTPPVASNEQPDASKGDPKMLNVDETIPETPPVPPQPPKEDTAPPTKVMSEIDNIIGKAKSEVESRLQTAQSKSSEKSDSSTPVEEGVVNTMKLIVGEEENSEGGQPSIKKADLEQKTKSSKKGPPPKKPKNEKPPQAKPEDVEELKVTPEEERRKHKGQVTSSKLSDQILKAIPPPRRKAISESKMEAASAGAASKTTPEADATSPDKATQEGVSEGKPSKTSSVPVPPPRNRSKPRQPTPPKGKSNKLS